MTRTRSGTRAACVLTASLVAASLLLPSGAAAQEGPVRFAIQAWPGVTVKTQVAMQLLEAGLKVKEYELIRKNFSETGNFGFGIAEHIDLGLKYDPTLGIFGMDFYVVLERPGYRVARRRHAKSRVGVQHKVMKEDAIKWFQTKFEGIVLNKAPTA